MPFKDRLAQTLRDHHLTQKAFAQQVGVDQATVSSWLLGRNPSLPIYERIIAEFPELASKVPAK